jgi:hypothetical protein
MVVHLLQRGFGQRNRAHGVCIMKTQATGLIVALILVMGSLVALVPDRAFAFSCGTSAVTAGDSVANLLKKCGPPTYRQTSPEGRGETWWYNEGAARFITKVVIFGGKITAIEEEDYGIAGPVIPAN